MQQEPSADRSMRVCKKYLNAGDLCFLTFYRIQFLLSFFFSFVRPVFRFTQQKCTRLLSNHAESILIQQQQQRNEGKKSMYSLTRHVSTFQLQLHTYSLQQHRFCSIFIPFCPAFNLSLSPSASSRTSHVSYLNKCCSLFVGFHTFRPIFFPSSNIKIAAVFFAVFACIALHSLLVAILHISIDLNSMLE